MALNASAPLLGRRRWRSGAAVGALTAMVVCSCVVGLVLRVRHEETASRLLQLQGGKAGAEHLNLFEADNVERQLQIARQMWAKGQAEEDEGERDMHVAQGIAYHILAEAADGNATNSSNSTDGETEHGPTLQDRGVNVNHWPIFDGAKNTTHAYNDTSPPGKNWTEDEDDLENRGPLTKARVNIGERWFWEGIHVGKAEEGGGNETANATDGGGGATNATNGTAGGDDESPGDKLKRLGVNVDSTDFLGSPPAPTHPKVKLFKALQSQRLRSRGEGGLQSLRSGQRIGNWFNLENGGEGHQVQARVGRRVEVRTHFSDEVA